MALSDGCCFRGCRGWPLGARVGLRSGSKIAVVLRARPEGPRRPPPPFGVRLPWLLPRAGAEPVEAADSWLLARLTPPPVPSLPLSRLPAPVGPKRRARAAEEQAAEDGAERGSPVLLPLGVAGGRPRGRFLDL